MKHKFVSLFFLLICFLFRGTITSQQNLRTLEEPKLKCDLSVAVQQGAVVSDASFDKLATARTRSALLGSFLYATFQNQDDAPAGCQYTGCSSCGGSQNNSCPSSTQRYCTWTCATGQRATAAER